MERAKVLLRYKKKFIQFPMATILIKDLALNETDICGYKSDFEGFNEPNTIDKFN